MPSRYAQWMYDWEIRLTSVDNNRVVRPLEWGLDWTDSWPGHNGGLSGQNSGHGSGPGSGDLLDFFFALQRSYRSGKRRLLLLPKAGGFPVGAPRG
jgi:hypothetical protein